MKSTGDKKTDVIISVVNSLVRMNQDCLGIDIDSIDLCARLLRGYADRECSPLIKKNDSPVSYAPEIDAVINLLYKVSYDLEYIRDIVLQDISELDNSLAADNKVLAAA